MHAVFFVVACPDLALSVRFAPSLYIVGASLGRVLQLVQAPGNPPPCPCVNLYAIPGFARAWKPWQARFYLLKSVN